MKKALIVRGGWDGHDPVRISELFAELLSRSGIEATISDSLASFDDGESLKALDLIVPVWTMGKLEKEATANVLAAVEGGTGLAGCHGGMCDAFRENTDWQFLTGGQWVAHPGNDGVEYAVSIRKGSSPLVEGIRDFSVKTEHYYLHVDPAVEVLATTRFPVADGPHAANGNVDMPVAWTKRWGAGRVFYCSLGHQAAVFDNGEARELMRRGLAWAAEGKAASAAEGKQ
ncbi:MAG: hypothetical protein A2Z99_16845 [Treponema sp. GWB1_62_6]|nr:MAG: hypothetical protein A2001_15555 [Treponema sp. GWC1_61_84]OHE65597.1 MAG: hypothetical protein A2Z99_16845 [Treponema sp. GWB1_62_6]HCM26859.1 hypothetical protein [Treponema sp.]